MKKLLTLTLLTLMLFVIALPALADPDPALLEEVTVTTAPTAEVVVTTEPEPEPPVNPTEGPWTWAYLATIAGATAATLLIVQFLKVPLDKAWKIPTRFLVYLIALIIMLAATAFTVGITVDNFPLCILNAFIVAMAAYGSYELTFSRFDHS